MNNDEIRDEEVQEQLENDKSLLRDMANKGISKTIKTLPLGTKILIFAIAGLVIFLLIFIVLVSVLSMFFFDFSIDGGNSNGYGYAMSENKENYWWPIGGSEIEEKNGKKYATGNPTTTAISSGYGYREYTSNGVVYKDFHYGIDIAPSGGNDYVIAVVPGEVYRVGTGCVNNDPLGAESKCNDGMGNYVTIKHNDGNYTRYAHLLPNSITVSVGDKVDQGQIIAQMGNSGASTGKHLDFKVFVGTMNTNASNPLEFISQTNTRPTQKENQLLAMIQSWEGTTTIKGSNYVIEDDGFGNLTVGYGITIEWQGGRFAKHGIEKEELVEGALVPIEIADAVKLEIIEEKRKSAANVSKKYNLDLEDYQLDALAIRIYNVGNMDGFVEAYQKYGNTQELYDNYMSEPVKGSNGEYSLGLERRRQAEWKLFHEGIYIMN